MEEQDKNKEKDKDVKKDKDSSMGKDSTKTPNRSKNKLSDQEIEAHEEEINNRINKLKNSKDSNKKLVFLQFVIISFLLIMIYTASLIWVYVSVDRSKSIVNMAYTLGALSVQIKMAHLVFSENLARQMTILAPDGGSLYAQAHSDGYLLGNQLTQNFQNFPAGYSDFQDYLKALLLQGVCSNYLAPVKSIKCQDDSVLMSGLELINIKVLEYAQQNLNRIAGPSNPWPASSWSMTKDLYSADFLTTGRPR